MGLKDESIEEQLRLHAVLLEAEVAFLKAGGWERRGGGWHYAKRGDPIRLTQEEAVAIQRRFLSRKSLLNGKETVHD